MSVIKNIEEGSFRDRAFGSILGAFVADACGSFHEFSTEVLSDGQMDECMRMPGGGTHGNGPGQITDDSEMALCILWGLVAANESSVPGDTMTFDINQISNCYALWLQSQPYDIGNTTAGALGALLADEDTKAHHAKKYSVENNALSMSNGCLMRVTPLAVWAAKLHETQLFPLVKSEVEITHPIETCQYAVYIYCAAIRQLLTCN